MPILKAPPRIVIAHLEVIVMPNGEVICAGQGLGWIQRLGAYLTFVRNA